MTLEYDRVRYKNKYYAIINTKHNGIDYPVVIDWKDLDAIDNLNKNWKCNNNGFISCYHTYNGETKEVFLHEIIMALALKDSGMKRKAKPIIHLNRMHYRFCHFIMPLPITGR